MWLILAALLILIVWALKFILGFAIWIAITASSVIAVLTIAIYIFRAIRASRAAKALEQAIAQQGAQQALNARPERRAEIQALQSQVQTGINALKSSKLGSGKKSGAAALYSLPWYMIVGPPGAGKTTALKHSGLVFPFADPQGGGGVRGVGGTRNCDWWFTNEAILLDTAGRYATESDDREEWMAFLNMLLKYRSRRPINGVFVAISITDLIDANEQQIEAMGKKLRARIDEVMTQLKMIVPVYVLFTKCDLVAGFSEFFGDIRKSDRAQAWGTTFKLDLPKTQPGALFDAEFDILMKHLHARGLKRLAGERSREAREKIYQFPLEFAGVKRNLSELLATIFMVNAFQGTPIFRGFYFTSGTQEGKPLDRVLGRMGQAMGIRPPEQAVQQVVESKSYFLYDVFMKVAFPDGDIAARSQGELKRQALMRIAVSVAALSLAVIAALPAIISYFNNASFLKETDARTKVANTIVWNDGRPATEKLVLLQPVLDQLLDIDKWRDDGVPLSMGWFMYEGEKVYRPTVKMYVSSIQQGFVVPCKMKLEDRLKGANGDNYLKERLDLKTYIMLTKDVDHLDVEWETGKLTSLWAEILRPTTNVPEVDLKKALIGHVHYYLQLLKDKKVTPVPSNDDLVDKVRKTLQGVPVTKRYYEMFVNSLIDDKYDEAGDSSRENKKYPPFTLGDMFGDRPDVTKVVTSARFAKEKKWKEVDGPYTEKGHITVVENIAQGAALLEREQWVVPLAADERAEKVPENLKYLAETYDTKYVNEWSDWFADITVVQPATLKDAIEEYASLTRPDWPYLRILRALEDHTQWKKDKSAFDNDAGVGIAQDKLKQKLQQTTQLRIDVDLKKLGDRVSVVPGTFKRTVEFGVPDAKSSSPITDTPLAKYVDYLSALRNDMIKMTDQNGAVDMRILQENLADTSKKADALLQPFDDKARTLLTPLLQNPFQIVGTPRLAIPGINRFTPIPNRFPTKHP